MAPSKENNTIRAIKRSLVAIAAVFAVVFAVQLSATDAEAAAPLGRVVALGDSLASGQGLGPQVPGSIADCGRSTGGYPEVAMSRVTHGTWVNATCNATTTDNFQYGWTGPSGAAVPPQYDSLNGSEDLVIVGSGNNEAFFGAIAYDCTGYQPAVDAFFHNRDYPQQPPLPIPNHCSDTYVVNGVNQIPNYVALSKPKVAAALTRIHQLSPNAKIILVGKPRLAKPSGSQCFNSEFWLTATDAPLYATWEDGSRQAMIDTVNAFNSSVPGNYAHFVDMQGISGTSHTGCETNWSDRWINPHTWQSGPQYSGIPLHHTPLGASVTANAIIDAIHAAGFDTGATPTNPVVSISSPASGIVTTSATIPVSFSATDNIRIASCSITSGASVALSPGANTIVVTCFDDAGNSGSKSVTVMRDAAPPVISISSPANGSGTTAASTQLFYTATDDVGTPNCTPASGTTFALSTGTNNLSVSCTDSVGRVATASIIVYRGTPPVVAISTPATGTKTAGSTVNVAYTVNGTAAIPGGTSCKVNGSASASATTNNAALAIGANSIVVDCTNIFGSGSDSVTVTRGNPPVVAITAPTSGTNTTATAVNASFTVDGAASIPSGTTCTVGGSSTSSATVNSFSLALGANTITVACTNAFGSGNAAVAVTRGVVPAVAITAPANGLNTTAASVNVTYTVDSGSSIPAGTTCTVNGSTSTSASSNTVALALGANSISVVCTNAFGSTPGSISVNRGNAPVVAITAPADGLNTTATSVNITYTVDGGSSIPAGTSCTVNGSASASTNSNSVALSLGANTISVVCTNAFGDSSGSITVNRGNPPVIAITAPTDGVNTTSASTNVSFTVNGAESIPSGTTCTVGGSSTSSATVNSFSLALGANTITVACANAFGSGNSAVAVTRGVVPSVAITAPSNGLNTTATSLNVTYTVDGGSSIPADTTCTVGGSSTSSATVNSFSLALGANTITVACTNAFGSGNAAVAVTRGVVPSVAITAPANDLNTTASSVNVTYTVDGGSSIPAGTTCTVNGSASTSTGSNSVALSLGANSITVACTNAFGNTFGSITVNRGNPPVVAITAPTDGLNTTANSVNATYTVDGAGAISGGTTCTVNGSASTSTGSNSVALALGANSITVACTNAFGSGSAAVTVARGVAPVVAILVPVDSTVTSAASVNVVFSLNGVASIPGGTACNVNGVATTDAETNSVALGIGSNAITVSCSSAFGTDADAVTVVRGTGPSVAITAPGNGLSTTASSINVAFTVDGAASIPNGTTCGVNGAPANSADSNSLALALGSNTIEVACSNALGDDTQSVIVYRGNPPTVAITAPADGLKTTAASTNVSFTVNGAASIPGGTSCTVNGSASGSATTNSASLAFGANSIVVDCTNNFGTGSGSVTVTRGDPPAVAITAPADGLKTTAASTNVSFTVNGAASIPGGTTCTVGGSNTSSATANPFELTLGANTITVACTNAFGSNSAAVTVTRGVAPSVEISAPSNGLNTTATTINVTYTVDGGPSIPAETTCTLNGSASSSATTNSVSLALGANTITVACTNAFGSASGSIVVNREVVDIVPPGAPTITRASPTETPTSSNQQTLLIVGAEPAGILSCKWNSAAYETCPESPVILSDLNDGVYELSVTQTDAAGNIGPAATVAWEVDTTAPAAPTVTRSSPSASPTSSTSQTISYGGEAGGTYRCKLDAGSYAPCGSSPLTFAGLSLGSHTFSVRQTDAAGNTSAASTVAWTIESAEPPEPPDDSIVTQLSAKLSSVAPKSIKPARSGSPFSLKSRGSVGSFRVTLSSAATVSLRLERVVSGASRASTTWTKFKLKSGRTKIYLSGRAKKRALAAGTYKVHLKIGGTKSNLLSKSFRIKR